MTHPTLATLLREQGYEVVSSSPGPRSNVFVSKVSARVRDALLTAPGNRAQRRAGRRPAPAFTLATCPTCRRPLAECVCHWTRR